MTTCPTCGEPASAGFKNAEGECSDAIHHAAFSASNECRADEGWHYFEEGLKVCRCGRLVARADHLERGTGRRFFTQHTPGAKPGEYGWRDVPAEHLEGGDE